jgi:hypothetical protein
MAKQILDAAQKKVVKAAKVGAEGVKDVATDALGAAASAAVDVVIGRVSEALGSGRRKPDEAASAVPQAVGDKTRSRKKPVKKKLAAKKRSATKAPAATKRTAVKNRSASKSVKNKKSTKTKGTSGKGAKKNTAVRGRRGR